MDLKVAKGKCGTGTNVKFPLVVKFSVLEETNFTLDLIIY